MPSSKPNSNPVLRLEQLGQSVWLDTLDRKLLLSGELGRMIAEDGVRGVTSNPTIFAKAITATSRSHDYAPLIRSAPPGETDASVLERLMVRDLRMACDELLALHESSAGADGFASIEVPPDVAEDPAKSIEAATRLWGAVNRPNLMVKIPGTRAALPAIEACLAHGININVTLLFSVERYREVIDAHLRALERRVAAGRPLEGVASVASFFVSRVDTKVDKLLDAMPNALRGPAGALRGQIAIANARVAYEKQRAILATSRWKALEARGARRQRLLWASTSPKDPAYRDLYYADELAGEGTIDTMTLATLRAYLDHGDPKERLDGEGAARDAHAQIVELASLGVDLPRITEQLELEGIAAFGASYATAIHAIADERAASRVRVA